MNLIDLDTFVRVAERGSLTAAAQALGVPKSTVSRRVARLEDELGLQLLQRTPRSVALTPEGERLVVRTSPALSDLGEAKAELEQLDAVPRGHLRITAPQDMSHTTKVPELFTSFREAYPEVHVELVLTNRVVDLVEEGIDVALRPHAVAAQQPHLTGRRLTQRMTSGLYASPAYLVGAPAITRVAHVSRHPWIGHPAFLRGGMWRAHHVRGRVAEIAVSPAITVNDFGMLMRIVELGAGIGLLPAPTTQARVSEGALVPLLPSWRGQESSLWAVWPKSRHMTPRVRAFVDHVVAWAAHALSWDG